MVTISLQYFNVWASTSSAHDNERAVKRLHTRQRFVNLEEQNMAQKQEHSKFFFIIVSLPSVSD